MDVAMRRSEAMQEQLPRVGVRENCNLISALLEIG
jgi:hypothetical protein